MINIIIGLGFGILIVLIFFYFFFYPKYKEKIDLNKENIEKNNQLKKEKIDKQEHLHILDVLNLENEKHN